MSQASQISQTAEVPSLEQFVALHKAQFEAIKLPKVLWKVVYKKLFKPTFIQDEDTFDLIHNEEGGYSLKAKKRINKNSNVYIIPHAASGDAEGLFKLFKAAPTLTEYLCKIVDLDATLEDPEKQRAALVKLAQEKIAYAKDIMKKQLEGIDEDMIVDVMEQAEVTRDRAEQALADHQGDLVAAIADCLMSPEFKALEDNMNKNLFQSHKELDSNNDFEENAKKRQEQLTAQREAREAEELLEKVKIYEEQLAAAKPTNEQDKYLQRVCYLYQALFRNHFVGVYFSMAPRDATKLSAEELTAPIRPEEVVKNYYIQEEMGSAIIGAKENNTQNENFICLSSGNSSWSLLWPVRDIKPEDVITCQPLQAVPCPLEFKW